MTVVPLIQQQVLQEDPWKWTIDTQIMCIRYYFKIVLYTLNFIIWRLWKNYFREEQFIKKEKEKKNLMTNLIS